MINKKRFIRFFICLLPLLFINAADSKDKQDKQAKKIIDEKQAMDEIVDEVDSFWQQQQKIALKYYQLILGDIDETFSTKGNFLLKKIAQQINAIKQSSINNEEKKIC